METLHFISNGEDPYPYLVEFPKDSSDKDPLHLEISPFIHFMVQILSYRSNNVYTVTPFKILNDMAVCTWLDL